MKKRKKEKEERGFQKNPQLDNKRGKWMATMNRQSKYSNQPKLIDNMLQSIMN